MFFFDLSCTHNTYNTHTRSHMGFILPVWASLQGVLQLWVSVLWLLLFFFNLIKNNIIKKKEKSQHVFPFFLPPPHFPIFSVPLLCGIFFSLTRNEHRAHTSFATFPLTHPAGDHLQYPLAKQYVHLRMQLPKIKLGLRIVLYLLFFFFECHINISLFSKKENKRQNCHLPKKNNKKIKKK